MRKIFNKNFHIKVRDKHHPINIGLIIIVILTSIITWFLTEYIVYELNQTDLAVISWVNEARLQVKAQTGTVYYVCNSATTCNAGAGSGWLTGSDLNNGLSKSTPWENPEFAMSSVSGVGPGDEIIVGDGVYVSDDDPKTDYYVIAVQVSGTAEKPIILRSENKHGAVLDGEGSLNNDARLAGINTLGNSYLVIDGFEIVRSRGGIRYNIGSHDVIIRNNKIHNSGRYWTIPNNCDYDRRGDRYFFGISGDTTSYNIIIDRNIVYDIGRLESSPPCIYDYSYDHGIYAVGKNIAITNNIIYDIWSGNRIKVDGHDGAYNGATHIIVNNTMAGKTNTNIAGASSYGCIMLFSGHGSLDAHDVIIENNICYNAQRDRMITIRDGHKHTGLIIRNNITDAASVYKCYGSSGADVVCPYADGYTKSGNKINILNSDFSLADPVNNDYNLTSGALNLIDKGLSDNAPSLDFAGNRRPHGVAVDIGAFEYGVTPCTPDCTGKECGSDGCGGSCGTCAAPATCSNGQCVTSDTIKPVVTAFDVQLRQTSGAVTASYTVTDNIALERVELWRAPYDVSTCNDTSRKNCSWTTIKQVNVSGLSASGTFTDDPAAGIWWYGFHAVDTAGLVGLEPSPPGPAKVTVKAPATSLSVGLHIITLTATDAQGKTAQDTIQIEILTASSLIAQINLLQTEYTQGETIYFTSSVSGGASPYTYSWKSDKQGIFSTAQWPTVNNSAWQTGTHFITLTVTDANANTATDNITITINPAGAVCGNSICDPGETCASCPADCGSCPATTGNIYYVCNNGTNCNAGSSSGWSTGNDSYSKTQAQNKSTPWKTVQKAADSVAAGDTIVIGSGVYYERVVVKTSGTVDRPIVFSGERGASGEWLTIIDGSEPTSGWVLAKEKDPNGYGVYKTTGIPFNPYCMTANNKDIPKLDHIGDSYDMYQYLAYSPTKTYTTSRDVVVNYWDGIEALYGYDSGTTYLRFRNGDNPASRNIRVSPMVAAVLINNKSYNTIKNLEIRGAQTGIKVMGQSAGHNIIENNHIMHGQVRIDFKDGTFNNIIRYNELESNWLSDYKAGAWLEILTESTYEQGVKEHIYRAYKHEIGKGTTSGVDDRGIDLEYSGSNNEIYGNHIFNSLVAVSDLQNMKDVLIYNNNFDSMSSVCITIRENAYNIQIFDNDFFECNHMIRIQETDRGNRQAYIYRNKFWNPPLVSDHFYWHWYVGKSKTGEPPEIYVYHNSFAGGSYGAALGTEAYTNGAASNSHFINNVISATYVNWGGRNPGVMDYNWLGGSFSTIPGTHNRIHHGEYMWDIKSRPDFLLPAGSDAIDAGIDLSKTYTINGKAYPALPGMKPGYFSGTAPDIGAIEYK